MQVHKGDHRSQLGHWTLREIVACNARLWRGFTAKIGTNMHVDHTYAHHYKMWCSLYGCKLLRCTIRGDIYLLSPHLHIQSYNCHLTINITISGPCTEGLGTLLHHVKVAAARTSQLTPVFTRHYTAPCHIYAPGDTLIHVWTLTRADEFVCTTLDRFPYCPLQHLAEWLLWWCVSKCAHLISPLPDP